MWQSFIMIALATNGDRGWSGVIWTRQHSRTLTPPSLTSHQTTDLPVFITDLPVFSTDFLDYMVGTTLGQKLLFLQLH